MLSVLVRRYLAALLVAPLALPPSLWAERAAVEQRWPAAVSAQPALPAEFAALIAELENADEHTPPQTIPDPFHLTQQYLLVVSGDGNRHDRYHLAGTEGGLPRILPHPSKVQAINFDGKLALRYKHGVHVIESIAPALLAYDSELLLVLTTAGELYALDMTFARRELFKAPLPLHKLPLHVESEALSGLQANFITRGFDPFTHVLNEQGTVQPLSIEQRFVAGDLALWRAREGARVLIDVLERDFIITTINNGNYLLGSLVYALRGKKTAAMQQALLHKKQRGQSVDAQQLEHYRTHSSEHAEQVLENMNIKRLMAMLLDDVEMNGYRDSFTYAHWQRDYLLLRKQAEVTVRDLQGKLIKDRTTQKKIKALQQQLQRGDLSASWIMLSELYTEEAKDLVIDRINTLKQRGSEAQEDIAELESIVANNDLQRLWDEPQLLVGAETRSSQRLRVNRFFYKHLQGENLQHLVSEMLSVGALGAVSVGTLLALRTGFSLSRLGPASLKLKDLPVRANLGGANSRQTARYNAIRNKYRRHLLIATALGLAIIPAVAAVGWLSARSSGHDWDFRKQLTLIGIRTYAAIALPVWHYLADFTGQKTLMPALAARVSPFAEVRGNTALGESIGLAPSASVHVGLQPLFAQGEEDEALRRRAIAALQQQRVRAQGLGWEMARQVIWREWLAARQSGDITPQMLERALQDVNFQRRWKKLAVGLATEIAKLQQTGVFPDLRLVSYEKVHAFIVRTKPQLLEVAYHENILRRASRTLHNVAGASTEFFATVATDDVNFLRVVDPDNFVASEIWRAFMIDFFTIVALEGTFGSRGKVFGNADDLGNLLATNKFPFMDVRHRETLASQFAIYQISVQGRYSLVFQMLEKIRESNYTPLAETLLVGKENPQGFFAGLLDLGGNSIDLRNVNYGSRFTRELGVVMTMLQASLLLTMATRVLVAKVPLSNVFPQFLFNRFWGTWGFAWPWVIYYSSGHLREQKQTTRLGMFMQAKVQLGMAVERDDPDGIQQGYRALVAVYRDFDIDVPHQLRREVEQVEAELRIAPEQRVAEAEILPHLALLVQMQNSDDTAEKRTAYRQLLAQIDNIEPTYVLSRNDAQQVLHFVMANPPLSTAENKLVNSLGIIICAVVTTIMGSWFFRRSFDFTSLRSVAPFVIGGSAVYTATWVLLENSRSRKLWNFVREEILGYPPDRAAEY